MKAGMAITTTQAPSVNLEIKKTTVAMAVTTAPMPLMTARRLPARRAEFAASARRVRSATA